MGELGQSSSRHSYKLLVLPIRLQRSFIMVSPVSHTTRPQPVAQSKGTPAQKPAAQKTQPATTDTVELSSTAQAQLAQSHRQAQKQTAKEASPKSHNK